MFSLETSYVFKSAPFVVFHFALMINWHLLQALGCLDKFKWPNMFSEHYEKRKGKKEIYWAHFMFARYYVN